ncbi:CHAT domain protein [Caballeronia calidae]|uniref:CHAT domain protein n=1 Tax=Caballeronia calidae TaxID=1777139 RepID=A0A158EH05_9BURK|nr:CHAT domain-containing protein [Caballeronia calidae]SAL05177.1 CHAT domain protein [Caballeronia calidae]
MADVPTTGPLIMIVASKTVDLMMKQQFIAVESKAASYPEMKHFLEGRHFTSVTNVEAAKRLVDAGKNPALIVLDASVLQSTTPSALDGTPAIDLMDWLEKMNYTMPVLVVASRSLENVDRKVLMRKVKTSLWLLGASEADLARFARTLAGLAPPSSTQIDSTQRITIMVGRTSARYSVGNGRYDFLASGDIPYLLRTGLDPMISNIEKISPFRATSGSHSVKDEWFETARQNGQRLYDVLIKDTVGPHLHKLLENPHTRGETNEKAKTARSRKKKGHPLDLRFEILLGSTDYLRLFQLPFEFVNHSDFDGVLCSHIPMARRIRLTGDDGENTTEITVRPPWKKTVKILFVRADASGDARLMSDTSYEGTEAYSFGKLNGFEKELDMLNELNLPGTKRIAEIHPLGNGANTSGNSLKQELEIELKKKPGYDILHFCGHSCTPAPDGPTQLIFPRLDGSPEPVSIREIARLMHAGGCRFLVLSSCDGASVTSAIEIMRLGAYGMLGFRWVVTEETCVKFFGHFYKSFLRERHTLSESYQFACEQLRSVSQAEPAWASAVAVIRD